MATCPRPTCNGLVVNGKCTKCGAFTYVGGRTPGASSGGTGTPQPSGTTQPVTIMKLHEWKHLTKLNLRRRSGSLRRLDKAIKEYELNRSPEKLNQVQDRFLAWTKKKGGLAGAWMNRSNDRNHKKAVNTLAKQLRGETVVLPRAFMEEGMENARLGIVFFFSNLEFRYNDFKFILEAPSELMGSVSSFGLFNQNIGKDIWGNEDKTLSDAIDSGIGIGTDLFKTGTILSTDLTNSGLQDAQAKYPFGATLTRIVGEFIRSIWSKLTGLFKPSWDNATTWVNLGVDTLKSLTKICVSILAEKVAPFVSGGMDIIGGIAKILKGARQLIVDAWRGRHTTMLPGHPSTIHTSLRLHMSRSIFQGFYEAIKGIANVAVDAISLALGAASYGTATAVIGIAKNIAGLIVSILEMIAKFMYRLIEGLALRHFIKKAKSHWENRDDATAIHKDHERFNKWYRNSAITIPVISALTINSYICGDSMRYLQMVSDSNQVVTQAQFNSGCKHLESLKGYGKKLIDDCGWHFRSDEPMVKFALSRVEDQKVTAGSAILNMVDNLFGA